MSESRDDDSVGWYSARKRGIIPMDQFRISSNVERIIRQERYSVQVNSCFREVMQECANRETTWISDMIINSFEMLHHLGHAHSVEMFDQDNQLVGGLYGVSLGAAFFGESMFKKATEADKVALWYCHQILQKNGFDYGIHSFIPTICRSLDVLKYPQRSTTKNWNMPFEESVNSGSKNLQKPF